jgi:hypothetical protein
MKLSLILGQHTSVGASSCKRIARLHDVVPVKTVSETSSSITVPVEQFLPTETYHRQLHVHLTEAVT